MGSVQGKHSESNLAGKYERRRVTGRLERGVGRDQITKGCEHQSKEFVLYLVGSGEPLRVFEQQSDMIRAVL